MEEKKITDKDEEIIKALKERKSIADSEFEKTGTPINFMMIPVDAILIEDILDLIHRLQVENERLNDMKFTQEHCDLYSENEFLKAGLQQQYAEIERLTEKCKGNSEQYELGFKCAEEMFNSRIDYCIHIESQNRELQKQVDELKNELQSKEISIEMSGGHIIKMTVGKWAEMSKVIEDNAVKDTATEILVSLIGCETQIDPLKTGIRWSVLKGFCKKYGVEAE